MAHPPEIRQAVKRAYIYDRMPLTQAARIYNVPEPTVKNWKARDKNDGIDWDELRAAARLSSGPIGDMTEQIVNEFALTFQSVIAAIKDKEEIEPLARAEALVSLADGYAKISKAATSMSPKLHELSIAMRVVRDLADLINKEFPQHASAMLEVLDRFGEVLQVNYA